MDSAVKVTQIDRDAAAELLDGYAPNYAALARKGCSEVDGLLVVRVIARHREEAEKRGADEITALRETLRAMCEAQEVQPYSGWNLTALNKATDRARELLGLPSIRDLNPDIAALQEAAAANKEAIGSLLANRGAANG